MANPEMGPQEPEPEEEIPQESEETAEKKQTPEEILAVINEAIEEGREVLLVQESSDGRILTNLAIPYSLEGNFLTIEADGFGFDIRIDSIKKAELS